jgi:hypothetical protein
VFKPGNCSLVGHGDRNYVILQFFCNNVVAAALIKEGVISRVQRHQQIGDTTVVIDLSMRKKEIGGAPAPKQLNMHRATALIIETTKN